MSFSEDVRRELAVDECKWQCCAKAELAAALALCGGVAFRGRSRYGLSLITEDSFVSRHFFSLIKRHFSVTCDLRTLKTNRLGEHTRYQLTVPDESVDAIMTELMLRDESALFGVRSEPAPALTATDCCRTAFLKSAFMICGGVTPPEKDYDMSFTSASAEMAERIALEMRMFELNGRASTRKTRHIAYLKGAEDISALLTRMGAHSAVLRLENARIVKQLRNQANRAANCDTVNIERTLRSAQSRIDEIKRLDETVGLENLPAPLYEIARLRLAEPNASLTELGDMCDPPIGKSGVNNRLRRLSELAGSMNGEDE